MFDKSCKNVLVRGVNWIGDSIMTLPALRALKNGLPDVRISLLVKPWVAPVFENNPFIDEIIMYDDKHKGARGKLRLAFMLRKKNFCGAILLQNAFDAALVAFLAGIKERAGYRRDGRGFLLTTAVPTPRNEKKVHQIYYYLSLIEQLGMKAEYSVPDIYLSLAERLHARNLFGKIKKPVLGINPGATYGSAKRWFPERFADIANWFIQDTGGSVVIFGSTTEKEIAEEIFRKTYPEFRTSGSVITMAGETSLRELIALISECDVFLTNDSGPLHIAYAVKTPLVALFGSTDSVLTGPPLELDGNANIVVTPDLSCSPCFERTCGANNMQCMYSITPDEVYYSIKKALPWKPAVFFDRDGTLCKDSGYMNNMNDLKIFSEIERIRLLKENGYKLVGVSNQSGIARGIVDEGFVKEVNNIFIDRYGFDDFYYCPHHPDEHCSCRKPEPGMLLKARAKHGIDLKKSYVVGDKEADMLLAKAVGAKSVLVQTGEAMDSPHADFIAGDLSEAVQFILTDSTK
jgi:heptosyltransferase II